MDFSNLQSRASSSSASYFPPHRTQLHPRMLSFSAPQSQSLLQAHKRSRPSKCLALFAFLLIIPFLYYLFTTALTVHNSSKFSDPNPKFHGLVIDAGLSSCRIRVFEFFNEGAMPSVAIDGSGTESLTVRPGLMEYANNPEGVAGRISELIKFAKKRVKKNERKGTKVVLVVSGGLERLNSEARDRILEACRQVLRKSEFLFRDEWARVITGEEEGIYAWSAVNFILGTLGSAPQDTTGVIELGDRSMQVTFAPRDITQVHISQVIKLGGTTYNLHSLSLQQFGQDAAWESFNELHNSRESRSFSISKKKEIRNPCVSRGYGLTSEAKDARFFASYPTGNYSACRKEVLELLRTRKVKCLYPPCKILPSSTVELQRNPIDLERFFYTSELFGMFSREGLSDLRVTGERFCQDDWNKLRKEQKNTDDMDLSRYCFSSAYLMALLHDSLGIPFDKRVHSVNKTGSIPFDWTLGAYVVQTMVDTVPYESDQFREVVGNESVAHFSLFALLLIVVLAAFLVSQWRKPQLKTVYDLEKGHYIVTRVPR